MFILLIYFNYSFKLTKKILMENNKLNTIILENLEVDLKESQIVSYFLESISLIYKF